MPHGFIGNAAVVYLTRITQTIDDANIEHTRAPAEANDRGMVHTAPFTPDTGKTGGYSTGKGNQSNVVVSLDEYSDTLYRATRMNTQHAEEIYNIGVQIAEMCSNIYIIPETSPKLLEYVDKLKSSLDEFQTLLDDARNCAHEFLNEISALDGGSVNLIVINEQKRRWSEGGANGPYRERLGRCKIPSPPTKPKQPSWRRKRRHWRFRRPRRT